MGTSILWFREHTDLDFCNPMKNNAAFMLSLCWYRGTFCTGAEAGSVMLIQLGRTALSLELARHLPLSQHSYRCEA